MSAESADVFIVGGGPAGLAAAISASKFGFRVTVADGAVPPINKPCGEGLMPDGLAALRALGVRLEAGDAREFSGSRFVDGDLTAAAQFAGAAGLGVRRTVLHQRMIEGAERAGVRLHWKSPVRELTAHGVRIADGFVQARWIVGADGGHSLVRRWAGLDEPGETSRRFCVRQHFAVAPWATEVVLYWCRDLQIFVTPVGENEVGVAVTSSREPVRMRDAIAECAELEARLRGASGTDSARGEVTIMRRLHRVYRDRVALIGDASGSVDSITGQGLCLAFLQAEALAQSLQSDDLAAYQRAHRQIMRKPRNMAHLLLLLAQHPALRRRVIRALGAEPALFSQLLGMHVGEAAPREVARAGLQLGWRFLSA